VEEIVSRVYSQGDNERVPCSEIPDIDLQPWAEPQPDYPTDSYYWSYYHHNSGYY